MGKIFFSLFFAALVLLIYMIYKNEATPRLGVEQGELTPCPNRPSCVSSQAKRPWQHVAPLPVTNENDPLQPIRSYIAADPHASIVAETLQYLHAIFRSPSFRFVDDVEFFYNPEKKVIEVRSGARIGYYDFGVNRERIEKVRDFVEKTP